MFKSLFGQTQKSTWAQLAHELGATFNEGTFFGGTSITHRVHDWNIVLDNFTRGSGEHAKTYTRLRAAFWNPSGLVFSVKQSSLWSKLNTSLLGGQDLAAGKSFFDERYVITGENEAAIQNFFSPPNLRTLMLNLHLREFKVLKRTPEWKGPFPHDICVLENVTEGMVSDLNLLRRLFDFFRLVLIDLYRINHPERPPLAAEDAPRLDALRGHLERELHWFAPAIERRRDGLEAPVTLNVGVPLRGMMEFDATFFPLPHVSLSLQAELPAAGQALELRTVQNTTERFLNLGDDNIGHPLLDDLFLIRGEPAHYSFLIEPLEALVRIAGNPVLEVKGTQLQLSGMSIPREHVETACLLFQKIWKAVALHTQEISPT